MDVLPSDLCVFLALYLLANRRPTTDRVRAATRMVRNSVMYEGLRVDLLRSISDLLILTINSRLRNYLNRRTAINVTRARNNLISVRSLLLRIARLRSNRSIVMNLFDVRILHA